MTLRHGKYGAFLGCSKYPECKGIVNIPKKGDAVYPGEELPSCVAIGCDGKLTARKSRFGKTFFSCTNYPDCDVIVSTPDQLREKYGDTHPKTPYIKKKGKGRFGKKVPKEESAKKSKKKSGLAQKAYKVSPDLAKIVGTTEISRPEATKKIWDYIKAHNLQDPTNKRRIIPDAILGKIIGTDPIDMMKLSTFLSKHLK
jgi:DNA topoisomerase-1